MSGAWGRMSGPCSTSLAGLLLLLMSPAAGCLGLGPDVRALELPSSPSVVLLIHGLGGLSIFTSIFWGFLLTPNHA